MHSGFTVGISKESLQVCIPGHVTTTSLFLQV